MNLIKKFCNFLSFVKISTASDVDSHIDIEEINRDEPLSKNLKDVKVIYQVQLVVGRITEDWNYRAFFSESKIQSKF